MERLNLDINETSINNKTRILVSKFKKISAQEINKNEILEDISIIVIRYITKAVFNKITLEELDEKCNLSIINYDDKIKNALFSIVKKIKKT